MLAIIETYANNSKVYVNSLTIPWSLPLCFSKQISLSWSKASAFSLHPFCPTPIFPETQFFPGAVSLGFSNC